MFDHPDIQMYLNLIICFVFLLIFINILYWNLWIKMCHILLIICFLLSISYHDYVIVILAAKWVQSQSPYLRFITQSYDFLSVAPFIYIFGYSLQFTKKCWWDRVIFMEDHFPIRPYRSIQLDRHTSKWSLCGCGLLWR